MSAIFVILQRKTKKETFEKDNLTHKKQTKKNRQIDIEKMNETCP